MPKNKQLLHVTFGSVMEIYEILHTYLYTLLTLSGLYVTYTMLIRVCAITLHFVSLEMSKCGNFYRYSDVRPPFTYAALIKQVSRFIVSDSLTTVAIFFLN